MDAPESDVSRGVAGDEDKASVAVNVLLLRTPPEPGIKLGKAS